MSGIGKFIRKKDSKDRLFLPKKIRDHFSSNGIKELVCVSFGTHVCYYTGKGWEQHQSLLNASISNEEQRNEILAGAQTITLQKAGRVLIPKDSELANANIKEMAIEFFEDFFKVSRVEKDSDPTLLENQLYLPFNSIQTIDSLTSNTKRKKRTGNRPKPSELPLVKVSLSDIRMEDRTFFNRLSIDIESLIESIGEHGQQVPVILKGPKPYTIVSGFRRIYALTRLSDRDVIAVIHPSLDSKKAYAISLIENVQRRSLSDYELIRALAMMKDKGYSTVELANLISKGRRIVEQYLRVWNGPESIKEALRENRISVSAAINAIGKNLSVEQVEGKSIREIIDTAEDKQIEEKGPIYFREFASGRITLKMQFDRKRHDFEKLIVELEKIIDDLKSKQYEDIQGSPSGSDVPVAEAPI